MGLFDKLFDNKEKRLQAQKYKIGMKKTRTSVFGNLQQILKSKKKIDNDLFDELEELFIMADIGVDTVVKFVDNLRRNVTTKKITEPMELKQIIVDNMFNMYLKDQVVNSNLLIEEGRLNVFLFVGVNGTGKTTSIGKIAYKYINEGKKVMLVAADTFRAGAIDQLRVWSERVGCSFYSKDHGSDPSSVAFDAINTAKKENIDIVLIDTAGRLQNKVNLMSELSKINRVINREVEDGPHETLLVIDATTGQNGLQQAKIFSEVTTITGIILTKLDGTAKGGIVLAIRNELDIPIKLIGLGEKLDDLEIFDIEDYIYGLFADVFE